MGKYGYLYAYTTLPPTSRLINNPSKMSETCRALLEKPGRTSHGRTYVSPPAKTYRHRIQPEDLPGAMDDRDGWWEWVRRLRAVIVTWWWWWCQWSIYIRSTMIFSKHSLIWHKTNLAEDCLLWKSAFEISTLPCDRTVVHNYQTRQAEDSVGEAENT